MWDYMKSQITDERNFVRTERLQKGADPNPKGGPWDRPWKTDDQLNAEADALLEAQQAQQLKAQEEAVREKDSYEVSWPNTATMQASYGIGNSSGQADLQRQILMLQSHPGREGGYLRKAGRKDCLEYPESPPQRQHREHQQREEVALRQKARQDTANGPVEQLVEMVLQGDAEYLKGYIKSRAYQAYQALAETQKRVPRNICRADWMDLEAKRIVEEKGQCGMTSLHYAGKHCTSPSQAKCIQVLLDCDASVLIRDDLGRVPLHHAAEMGQIEALKLLSSKESLKMKDDNAKLAIMLAAQTHQLEAIAVLREMMTEHKVVMPAKEFNELCAMRSFESNTGSDGRVHYWH